MWRILLSAAMLGAACRSGTACLAGCGPWAKRVHLGMCRHRHLLRRYDQRMLGMRRGVPGDLYFAGGKVGVGERPSPRNHHGQ